MSSKHRREIKKFNHISFDDIEMQLYHALVELRGRKLDLLQSFDDSIVKRNSVEIYIKRLKKVIQPESSESGQSKNINNYILCSPEEAEEALCTRRMLQDKLKSLIPVSLLDSSNIMNIDPDEIKVYWEELVAGYQEKS